MTGVERRRDARLEEAVGKMSFSVAVLARDGLGGGEVPADIPLGLLLGLISDVSAP